MPRKEKSFFGKIMGGDVTDTEVVEDEEILEDEDEAVIDEEEDFEDETDPETEEEYADDDYEEVDEDAGESEEDDDEAGSDQDLATDYTPQNSAISQRDEEWVNDYEGALNIDMYQTKDNVIIKSTIAGVRPDDIDITVANDMVTIKGSRSREEKIHQDDYFYQECYWGSFSRSVIVPVDIDSENIEADLKDGILTVIVPKAAKAKTKKVKVKGL